MHSFLTDMPPNWKFVPVHSKGDNDKDKDIVLKIFQILKELQGPLNSNDNGTEKQHRLNQP